ncbi:MAG: helix-turn-helix domain-containing protein [Dysgonomonas sp.]
MEVITLEAKAYQELVTKINAIAQFVIEHQQDPGTGNPDEMWVDSYEVCTFLKISQRTLQRLRSKRIISYSMISGKSYYTIAEIKRMLAERKIRSSEECIDDLIHNYKFHAQQRRSLKKNR